MTTMDKYVDALFFCLPAESYREISKRMSKRLGYYCGVGTVANTLHHVRKHAEQYGWRVAQVKRGAPKANEQHRIFHMLLEPDGTFSVDKENRHDMRHGARSTVATMAAQSANVAADVSTFLQYENSRQRRDVWEEIQENAAFVAKRLKRLLAEIDQAA